MTHSDAHLTGQPADNQGTTSCLAGIILKKAYEQRKVHIDMIAVAQIGREDIAEQAFCALVPWTHHTAVIHANDESSACLNG